MNPFTRALLLACAFATAAFAIESGKPAPEFTFTDLVGQSHSSPITAAKSS